MHEKGDRAGRRPLLSLVAAIGCGLLGLGLCVLSGRLMLLLIHFVGEERALGPQNVYRLDDGAVLLTNPGAMVMWMLPFLALGIAFLIAACVLALRVLTRPKRERSG